jgi:hypothetical protein
MARGWAVRSQRENIMKSVVTAVAAASFFTMSAGAVLAVQATKIDTTITQAEVEAAQVAWGEALV